MDAVPRDIVQWIAWLLYGLGFLALWVYSREQNRNEKRITDLEKDCPTREEVTTMIEAALYRDITRP